MGIKFQSVCDVPGWDNQLLWHLLLSKLLDVCQWASTGSYWQSLLSWKSVQNFDWSLLECCDLWKTFSLTLTLTSFLKTADNCIETLRSNPICADSGWSLWFPGLGRTLGSFCCMPGLVGLKTGGCVPPSDITGTDGPASLVSLPHPLSMVLLWGVELDG